jgi:peptidoglycan L-alanyl-D-glutamate endopeptidase CwlK
MPQFGQRSLLNLSQCHPALQAVAQHAVRNFDFAVICGHRGEAEQAAAFARGVSKARWLQSPHNFAPALAFDAVPWPLDWGNLERFDAMARELKLAAVALGVGLTWGGDFRTFKDRPHFELSDWRNRKHQV